MPNAKLIVKYELFRGTFTTWNTMLTKAASFASRVGHERLINITHSAETGAAIVTVWYWADPS
jgi:hypothetical protein